MKKFLLGFLAVAFVLALALFLGRNILVRTIMVKGAEKVCGLKIDVAKVDISLPRVAILGLKVYNPAGFADPVLADIPEVSMSFDLPAFFKNKIYLGNLTLDVRELHVILNEQGKLNVNSLALLLPRREAAELRPRSGSMSFLSRSGKSLIREMSLLRV